MNDADSAIALLAAANPVPELPAAEPPERLRRSIEAEGQAARRHRPTGRMVRTMAAALAAMLAATVGLLLSNGASSPGLNVAAAAYAATSSGSGVLEARFLDSMFLPHGRVVASHHREWIDASTGMRRERRTLSTLTSRHPQEVYELASSLGWIETWDSAAGELNVIRRIRYSTGGDRGGVPDPGPHGGTVQAPAGGATAQAPAGVATYRRLYRERSLKLVGRERRDGRMLWKLEGDVAFAFHSFRAKPIPIMAMVVLVDPRTYLPVVQRTVDLLPGHRRRVQTESELLGYRRLPGGAASEALLKLYTQHPRARVLTNPAVLSHYISERMP
jgi:hypothetical protein